MSEFTQQPIADMSDREIQEQQLDELRLIRRKTASINGIMIFYLVCSIFYGLYLYALVYG